MGMHTKLCPVLHPHPSGTEIHSRMPEGWGLSCAPTSCLPYLAASPASRLYCSTACVRSTGLTWEEGKGA